jgi:hypothetical protein
MRYIAVMIWSNGRGEKAAQMVQEEGEPGPRYFERVEEIMAAANPNFPADIVCINLDTLEIEIR